MRHLKWKQLPPSVAILRFEGRKMKVKCHFAADSRIRKIKSFVLQTSHGDSLQIFRKTPSSSPLNAQVCLFAVDTHRSSLAAWCLLPFYSFIMNGELNYCCRSSACTAARCKMRPVDKHDQFHHSPSATSRRYIA